jgi:aminopeptidase N
MRFILFITLSFLLISCFTNKKSNPVTFEPVEFRDLDTLIVDAPKPSALKSSEEYVLPVYQAANERKVDLLHTLLGLKFDWENEKVIGNATLHLKPYFDTIQMVTLDAKQLEVSAIQLQVKNQTTPIHFENTGNQLYLYLLSNDSI